MMNKTRWKKRVTQRLGNEQPLLKVLIIRWCEGCEGKKVMESKSLCCDALCNEVEERSDSMQCWGRKVLEKGAISQKVTDKIKENVSECCSSQHSDTFSSTKE